MVWHLDVGSSHPGAEVGPKGWAFVVDGSDAEELVHTFEKFRTEEAVQKQNLG